MTSPLDRARELRAAAEADPDAVNPDDVLELLRYPTREVQREAAEAFLLLVTEHPETGTAAVGRLAYLLRSVDSEAADPDLAFGETLLLSLARIASVEPEKALTAREEVLSFLDDPEGPLVGPASVCLAQFVEAGAASFVTQVDTVAALLDADNPAVRRNAAHILTKLGATHPGAIESAVETLRAHLTDSDPETAKKAAVAVGLVAQMNGAAAIESVPELAGVLDDDERGLRANAAGALADIAADVPEVVADHEDALLERLDDDAASVRRNAAAALARVAATGSSMKGAAQRGLIELLDDPDTTVRVTACQALGTVDSPMVKELLRQTATDDDSPAVREAAERALERA